MPEASVSDNINMERLNLTCELAETRDNGKPTLILHINGRTAALHSRLFPSREEISMEKELYPGKEDVLVVLGTGLGYHLAPLKKYGSYYKKIILTDILPQTEDLSGRFLKEQIPEREKTVFLCGLSGTEAEAALAADLNLENIRGVKIVEHPASMRLFGEYYSEIRQRILAVINRQAGSLAAARAFGSRYFRNGTANLAQLGNMKPVKALTGKFSGLPAVVLASGPSLEKSMEAVRQAMDRVYVIAVDSALPVCRAFGVKPDFTVSVDPQPFVREHLYGMSRDIRLVTGLTAYPLCFRDRDHLPEIWVSLNSHPLSQLTEECFPDTAGSADSGTGSVAGDAVIFACRCGFSRIACAGFDFSFDRGLIYARGTSYQRRYAELFSTRLLTPETSNLRYIMKASGGYRKNGLFTRKVFETYREKLEMAMDREVASDICQFYPGDPVKNWISCEPETFFDGCRESLNKEAFLSSISDSVPLLGKTVQFDEVLRLAAVPDVFRRLTAASVPGDRRAPEYRLSLIKNFLKEVYND